MQIQTTDDDDILSLFDINIPGPDPDPSPTHPLVLGSAFVAVYSFGLHASLAARSFVGLGFVQKTSAASHTNLPSTASSSPTLPSPLFHDHHHARYLNPRSFQFDLVIMVFSLRALTLPRPASASAPNPRSQRERQQHLHASVTPYPLAPHLEGCVLDIGRGGVRVVSVGGEDRDCGASSITTRKNRLRAPSSSHHDRGFDKSQPTAPAAKQEHLYSTRPLATVTNFNGRAPSAGGPPRKSLPLSMVKTRRENGENIHIHRQSEHPPKKQSPLRKMPLRYLHFGTRTSPTKVKAKSKSSSRAESCGLPTKGKAISSAAPFHNQAADESVDWAARIRSVFYNKQWEVDDDLPESIRDYFFTRDSVGSGDESIEISKDDDPLGVRSTRAIESLAAPGAQAQSSSELAYLGSSSSNIGHCDSDAALSSSSSGASGAFNDLLASVDRKYPGRRWVEIVQFSAGEAQDATGGVMPRDKRKRNGLQQWSDIFCLDEYAS